MAENSDSETSLCIVWKTEPIFGVRKDIFSSFIFTVNFVHYCYLQLKRIGIDGLTYRLSLIHEVRGGAATGRMDVTVLLEKFDDSKVSDVCSFKSLPFPFENEHHLCILHDRQICKYCTGADSRIKIVCLFHGAKPDLTDLLPPRSGLDSLWYDMITMLKIRNRFPDVTLRCGDRSISAHRSVLSARSEVFAAMFRHSMLENKTGIVSITDFNYRVIDKFLEYLYTGKIRGNVSVDVVLKQYEIADKYAVNDLKVICRAWLIGAMSSRNCISFLKLADRHGDSTLKNATISYICSHDHVLQSSEWLEFSAEQSELAIEVYEKYAKGKQEEEVQCST